MLVLVVALAWAQKGGDIDTASPPDWKDVERLVNEQKMQAAYDAVIEILERGRAEDDADEITRALVEAVQLRTALHGYETAVKFLMTEPWPDDPVSRTVLRLYTAHSLANYVHVYSWKIRQRERVITDDEVDLERWTLEQLVGAAHRQLAAVWDDRDTWGDASLGTLSRYIDQNSYPARIRGTLRDAVSYMWSDLLIDSSLWRPVHANETWRLDAVELLDAPPEVDLDSTDVHPLAKLAFVLGDLERWHADRDEPEAALEAYLERARRLHDAVDGDDDEAAIRGSVADRLEAFDRSLPWYSWGAATLADLWRGADDPDALVRAHNIAADGVAAHPKSLGGQRSRHIVASLEAPSYSLEAMAADGPDRRSIGITHANLERLYLRAYRFDVLDRVESAEDRALLPSHQDVPRFLERRTPVHEWTVDLPPTPDYRTHRTWVTPPMTEPGGWVVVASARADFARPGNRRIAVSMVVTDLVLVTRRLDDHAEVTVRSGPTGEPVSGAEVWLYRYDWQRGHHRIGGGTTGADGRVSFSEAELARRGHFLVARRDGDVVLDGDTLYPQRRSEPTDRTAALLYTDRSVYRPGQEVLWKAVAYSGGAEPGVWRTLSDRQLTITLRDANGEEVAASTVGTNAFGSAAGAFTVPPGRLLGQWHVVASIGGSTPVRVEEYKRPTFEVELTEPPEALRLNREAALAGAAEYYFGLPVSAGQVTWRVSREPIYPRWWFWWYSPPSTSAQIIASGETGLDADGRFSFSFVPEADEDREGVRYRFRAVAEVTEPGGETRSAERVFTLGLVAVQASISSDLGFLDAGEPSELEVRRTDLNGAPRAGAGSWRLVELIQPEATLLPAERPVPEPPGGEERCRTPGDRLRPRWNVSAEPEAAMARWESGNEVAAGVLEHGDDGLAAVELPPLDPGAYRLTYTTSDPFGAEAQVSEELLVAGPNGLELALPAVLIPQRTSVAPGGTVRLLVHSGLDDQPMVLELWRDRRRRDRLPLTSASSGIIELPVSENDRGGFGASLTLLRDYQLLRPTAAVLVPWDDRELAVELATFRDRVRPGDTETFTVTVRAADGEPPLAAATELLAYMYDRSLDLFAAHTPPDAASLYPTLTGIGGVDASLGTAPTSWHTDHGLASVPSPPHLTDDSLKFLSGYGIGGMGARGRWGEMKMMAHAPMAADAAMSEEIMVQSADMPAEEAEADATDGGPAEEPVELRSDFAETAFWRPHLEPGDDGSADITFTVPDSVTDWSLWVHALTKDLRHGRVNRTVASVKELMVRPALPRFLREGDHARLEVVVNNASEETLEGSLRFSVEDPDTGEDLSARLGLGPDASAGVPFTVSPSGGTTVSFPVEVSPGVGEVAVRVVARAGDLSDGELRPLPILPGRVHLVQSRFATLRDAARRELDFPDMRADDPTRIDERLIVTVEAQLFYSVLDALPYLVRYPYECTEQTLNRFVSTGIVSSLYDRYPAVGEMAEKLSGRDTRTPSWEEDDPNRTMLLVETPWLAESRGGGEDPDDLINVLDPEIARAERETALAKLRQAQTSLGAFPWFPGGPPSPYMTLYLLAGFSRAIEFDVEVPRDLVVRAWAYLHRWYVDDVVRDMIGDDCCWEMVTFLNYVLSSYPDEGWTGGVFTADDRRRMLEFSFSHWREHSPLLKGLLALTLDRAGRHDDAVLVFDSVMDSARTTEDEGTFWTPEERGWLWYNDTVEGHATALRTLIELDPDDARRHGIVQWLLLNKQLNRWDSTRSTAEVIYALVHYLEQEQLLASAEAVTVEVGPRTRTFEFTPDEYTGADNRVIVEGPEIDPETMSTVVVEKDTRGFAFASATWHFSTERMPDEASGDLFRVTRRYFKREAAGGEWTLTPLEPGDDVEIGDQVEVQLTIASRHPAEYVHLRDPRGAGFEPETLTSGWRFIDGLGMYEEVRDSGTNFFIEWLPHGEYTLRTRLRATVAGTFKVGPATLQSMYAPEFAAYSSGAELAIGE